MKFGDAAERWNQRFSKNDALFGEQPNQWLAAQAGKIAPASRICCVADGQGRNGLYLAEQGHRVTALDVSSVAIDQLKAKAIQTETQIVADLMDIADWDPAAESFDAIVAIYFQFADPVLRDQIFANIAHALLPGGLLIIEGYGPRQLQHRTGGPGVLENLYAPLTIASGFPQWPVLVSRDCDLFVSEGDGHEGISHVVSAVLQKPG